MLRDEEREALQYFNTETKTEAMHYGAVLVKLIEKQSKEIEELKREKAIYYYEWKHLEANVINNYTSNDKIKAKIEEYENKIKKIRSKKLINEPEDTIIITRYAHYISVLQSLLEKE